MWLTQADILEVWDRFVYCPIPQGCYPCADYKESADQMDSVVSPYAVGVVSQPSYMSTESAYAPTWLNGYNNRFFQERFGLAPLKVEVRDGVTFDPMASTLTKHQLGYARARLDYPLDDAVDCIARHDSKFRLAPLPRDWDSVVQSSEIVERKPVDVNKSIGYPFAQFACHKKELFEMRDGKWYLVDWAKEAMDVLRVRAEAGEALVGLSALSKKDEKRKLEKVLEGKTRLFAAWPVHLFLLGRYYFQDVVGFFMTHQLKVDCAMGITPLDWGALYDFVGSELESWDYSSFDVSVTPLLLTWCFLVWLRTGLIENKGGGVKVHPLLPQLSGFALGAWTVFRHIVQPMYVSGHYLLKFPAGHPSGSVLTTVINVTVQRLMAVASFRALRPGS
jgi:hypothetical protein